MDDKQLQAIFNEMSAKLDLGDFNMFKNQMSADPKFRKAFFTEASKDLELGDYNTFDSSFKKKDGTKTSAASPSPSPFSFQDLGNLSRNRPVTDSPSVTAAIETKVKAQDFAQQGKPMITVADKHKQDLEAAKKKVQSTIETGDQTFARLIREERVNIFDQQRSTTPQLDGMVNPAAETAKRETLMRSIVTPEEVITKKQQALSDDKLAREVIKRNAKKDPELAKSAYLIDAEQRTIQDPTKTATILQNADRIAKGELTYDVKRGILQKPEGTFTSLINGLKERNRQMEDYDFLANTLNDDAIISQLEADRKSVDPDQPVSVPEGGMAEFGQMLGSEGIAITKGAGAAVVTAAIPGAQIAAPYVAAFASTPEYYKRSFATAFRDTYYQLREKGVVEREALATARKQAETEGNYGAAEGFVSGLVGARMGLKPLVATPGMKNAVQSALLNTKNFVRENVVDGLVDGSVAGGLQIAKNKAAIDNGLERNLFDGVPENIQGELTFSVGMGLLTKGGRKLINENTYRGLLNGFARQPKEVVDAKIGEMVVTGKVKPNEAVEIGKVIDAERAVDSQIPSTVSNDEARVAIADKIKQREDLKSQLSTTNEVFHGGIKEQIDAIDKEIIELSKGTPAPELSKVDGIEINQSAITSNTAAEVDKIKAAELEPDGGVTLNLDGTKYEGGGLVVPIASMNTTQEDLTPQMIADFAEQNKSKLSNGQTFKIGLYKFPGKNQVSIDLTIVTDPKNQDLALEFGRKAGQESLFDLDTLENIKTGGDGQNPMSFSDEQVREIGQAFAEGRMPKVFEATPVERALEEAIPVATKSLEKAGIKFQVIDGSNETPAGKAARGNQALFLSDDGTIIIDKSKLENDIEAGIVVWHEASHPVMNIIRNTNKPLYDKVVKGLEAASKQNEGVAKALNWAQSQPQYDNVDTQNDEAIVETIGRINTGLIDIANLDAGLRQSLIDFVNGIAKFFGIDPILNDTDIAAFKKTVSQVADALKQGRDIAEVVGEENVSQIQAPAPQSKAVTVAKGTETLKRFGLPEGRNTTRKIGEALEKRTRGKYGVIARDDRSPEAVRKISTWMVEEVKYFLGEFGDKSGKGWYGEKFQKGIDKMADVFPELATDQNARDLFTMMVAVTSDGTEVMENFKQASQAYDYYKKNNKMPETASSQRAASYVINFNNIQNLLDQFGGDVAKMKEYLLQVESISDLNKKRKTEGLEALSTSWPASFKVPIAASIFGPKLGMFYANLSGMENYPTLDRWWSRTFNRYRGTLIPQVTRGRNKKGEALGIDAYREVAGLENASEDEVIANIIQDHDSYENKGYKNGTVAEKKANTLYKKLFVELNDAPFGKTDRKFMYDAFVETKKRLKAGGVDVSIADIQAILWYFEKNLYKKLGVTKPILGVSYEEAAAKTAQKYKDAGNTFSYEINKEEQGETIEEIEEVEEEGQLSAGNRGELLAPNGKPSKLNERQYQQVRTPEFKNWFGDWENDPANASKVVDENGEPRVVYHGTNNTFDEFKKEKLGSKNWMAESAFMGFFFAGDRSTSEAYTGMNNLDMVGVSFGQYDDIINKYKPELDKAKNDINEVYSRVRREESERRNTAMRSELEKKRKTLLDSGLDNETISNFFKSVIDSRVDYESINALAEKELEEGGYKDRLEEVNKKVYAEIEEAWRKKTGANPQVMELFLNIKNPLVVDYKDAATTNLPSDIQEAIGTGKDGVIFNNLKDGAEADDIFVALEPNQIKSATDNVGTFSTEDNRIQFSAGNRNLVENAGLQKKMTEDGDGNYVFFHYSDKKLNKIDPSKFGSNLATGRDERPGVGISMFYTDNKTLEPGVSSEFGYAVRVPKDKVYPFNEDPLNFYDQAKAEFEKDYPGQAFDSNKQIGYITKVAADNGFDMTVANWNIKGKKALRAQTTKPLKPEVYKKRVFKNGSEREEFNEELQSLKPGVQYSAGNRNFLRTGPQAMANNIIVGGEDMSFVLDYINTPSVFLSDIQPSNTSNQFFDFNRDVRSKVAKNIQNNLDFWKNELDKTSPLNKEGDVSTVKTNLINKYQDRVDALSTALDIWENNAFSMSDISVNKSQLSAGNRSEDDLRAEGTGEERERALASKFGELSAETQAKIEDDAAMYFQRPNKQTEKAVDEFIEGRNLMDMADYVLDKPDIPEVSRVWMAATVAKRMNAEIDAAKSAGDQPLVDALTKKQADIYNEFAKQATSLGQAVQAFIAFKGDPNAVEFFYPKLARQLKKKGVENITDDQKAEIISMLKDVNSAAPGIPKDKAIIKLSHYLGKMVPMKPMEVLQALWYAKILSGITTQSTNFFANVFNTFFELPAVGIRLAIKSGNPMAVLYGLKGLGSGIVKGAVTGADILKSGVRSKEADKLFAENALEYFTWSNWIGEKGKVLDKIPPLNFGAWKYVGRLLAATDALFSTANKEAVANMLAYAQSQDPANQDFRTVNQILGNTKQDIMDAKAQAKAEGLVPGTMQYKRRLFEIISDKRGAEISDEADAIGKRITMNYDPEGWTKPIFDGVVGLQQSIPAIKMVIPFARIVANLTENALNYSPAGFVRAATGIRNPFNSKNKYLTTEERIDIMSKFAIGMGALAIMATKAGDDEDDWFEITAGGSNDPQKKYELQKGGWRPYTITFKDGTKLSYKDWPIAGVLAGIGHMRDAKKYSFEDSTQMGLYATGFFLNFYDKSLLSGLSDFFGIFDVKAGRGKYAPETKASERATKYAAQQVKSVALSNLAQQTGKLYSELVTGDPQRDAKTFMEVLYRDIPVINDGIRPIIDVFGDPVKYNTTERLTPVSSPEKDKLIKWLNENKFFVGVAPKRNIFDMETMTERPMTDDEYYEYKKLAGQRSKEWIMNMMTLIENDNRQISEKAFEAGKKAARDLAYVDILMNSK